MRTPEPAAWFTDTEQAESSPNLIPDWHRERIGHPAARSTRRSARLGRSLVDSLTSGLEATLFWGATRLPHDWACSAAPGIGLLQRAGSKTRGVARMQTVLGADAHGAAGWSRLWHRHLRHVGLTAIEGLRFGMMNRSELVERVSLAGEEHLRAALERGRGAMLFLTHLGSLGVIPAALGPRGYDISITGNAMPRPSLERKVRELYAHGGVERILVGDRLPSRAAHVFRRNGVVASYFDYTVVERLNCWLPFGRAELMTNLGPALIALRNRAPLLYAECRRLAEGRFELRVSPLRAAAGAGDALADARSVTQAAIVRLAEGIEERPEEWWPWDCTQVRPRQSGTASSLPAVP